MARLLLRCGCDVAFDKTNDAAPVCPTHGNQAVVRVIGMPKPKIRGTATGPLVETIDLPAWSAPFAPKES
jgi:hypothetical protein